MRECSELQRRKLFQLLRVSGEGVNIRVLTLTIVETATLVAAETARSHDLCIDIKEFGKGIQFGIGGSGTGIDAVSYTHLYRLGSNPTAG